CSSRDCRGLHSFPTRRSSDLSFDDLKRRGARVQRPLWASTSTKNPAYRDVLYIEELIGPNTINTIPPATADAFLDHGRVQATLRSEEHTSELQSLAYLVCRLL